MAVALLTKAVSEGRAEGTLDTTEAAVVAEVVIDLFFTGVAFESRASVERDVETQLLRSSRGL